MLLRQAPPCCCWIAEECVVEKDTVTGALMVGGARENTFLDGDQKCDPAASEHAAVRRAVRLLSVCEPAVNPNGPARPDSGLICMECVQDSWSVLAADFRAPAGRHAGRYRSGGRVRSSQRSWLPGEAQLYDRRRIATQCGTAVVAFMVMQGVASGCDTTAFNVMN